MLARSKSCPREGLGASTLPALLRWCETGGLAVVPYFSSKGVREAAAAPSDYESWPTRLARRILLAPAKAIRLPQTERLRGCRRGCRVPYETRPTPGVLQDPCPRGCRLRYETRPTPGVLQDPDAIDHLPHIFR